MNGRYLLETNAVIALFENEARLLERLAAASETFVPTIALGELYFGAAKSRQATEDAARIDEFAASSSVLGRDSSVAREYGRIKNRLREEGRPLPENDIWIAATAHHYGLVLVTRDRHSLAPYPASFSTAPASTRTWSAETSTQPPRRVSARRWPSAV